MYHASIVVIGVTLSLATSLSRASDPPGLAIVGTSCPKHSSHSVESHLQELILRCHLLLDQQLQHANFQSKLPSSAMAFLASEQLPPTTKQLMEDFIDAFVDKLAEQLNKPQACDNDEEDQITLKELHAKVRRLEAELNKAIADKSYEEERLSQTKEVAAKQANDMLNSAEFWSVLHAAGAQWKLKEQAEKSVASFELEMAVAKQKHDDVLSRIAALETLVLLPDGSQDENVKKSLDETSKRSTKTEETLDEAALKLEKAREKALGSQLAVTLAKAKIRAVCEIEANSSAQSVRTLAKIQELDEEIVKLQNAAARAKQAFDALAEDCKGDKIAHSSDATTTGLSKTVLTAYQPSIDSKSGDGTAMNQLKTSIIESQILKQHIHNLSDLSKLSAKEYFGSKLKLDEAVNAWKSRDTVGSAVFDCVASFPDSQSNPYESGGNVVLLEGMRFSSDGFGNWQLVAPYIPGRSVAELYLQLKIETCDGKEHSLTLSPICLPARQPCGKNGSVVNSTCGSGEYSNSKSSIRLSGHSHALDRYHGSFTGITRTGYAVYGTEYTSKQRTIGPAPK